MIEVICCLRFRVFIWFILSLELSLEVVFWILFIGNRVESLGFSEESEEGKGKE